MQFQVYLNQQSFTSGKTNVGVKVFQNYKKIISICTYNIHLYISVYINTVKGVQENKIHIKRYKIDMLL